MWLVEFHSGNVGRSPEGRLACFDSTRAPVDIVNKVHLVNEAPPTLGTFS